jgi:hypothetical protein
VRVKASTLVSEMMFARPQDDLQSSLTLRRAIVGSGGGRSSANEAGSAPA